MRAIFDPIFIHACSANEVAFVTLIDFVTEPIHTNRAVTYVVANSNFLKDVEAAAKALHDFSFFTLTSFAFAFRRRGVLEMGWGLPLSCLRIPFRFQPYSIDAQRDRGSSAGSNI